MLLDILLNIKDFRRKQARQYQLGYVLYFSILAILSNASSYRKIYSFVNKRFDELKDTYSLKWKTCPAYSTIRNIIQGVSSTELEMAFREHAKKLSGDSINKEKKTVFC